jgi:hypothetical protein
MKTITKRSKENTPQNPKTKPPSQETPHNHWIYSIMKE